MREKTASFFYYAASQCLPSCPSMTGRVVWEYAPFTGGTESQQLIDIVNQKDYPANIDGNEKFGQPMVSVAGRTDYGNLVPYPWKPASPPEQQETIGSHFGY